ncbi:MAG: Dam family site-specific DNA-(adenine-N6)-methyltransferase [Oscillospiraceae bacterium]|jgi:DNA adenine methylase|nr:Dam family site-specific DNA-(adenine-N6)-methyltransferase [Oscillospiraceae bacterium]
MSYSPVIKWSGSKRSQAAEIVKFFPDFERYYEPFIGGGSVLRRLSPERAICGDLCEPLIDLYQFIVENPIALIEAYSEEWYRLKDKGQGVYYEIRRRFNKLYLPQDLLFLSRTCANGLIRFNRKGEFNNGFHITRDGIKPETLGKIILEWSEALKNVEFRRGDYRQTTADITDNDFVYLDPPYFATKGMYYGGFEFEDLCDYLEYLNSRGIKFALSYDGISGDKSRVVELPKELYKQHKLIKSGLSSFKRLQGNVETVYESLYLNFE